MAIEDIKNRDIFLKITFRVYLNNLLKILGIKEYIIDTIPTEYNTIDKKGSFKILNSLLDFAAITKSKKIIIFEFKKNPLTTKDLKQVNNYVKEVQCEEKTEVMAIIIVISKYGKIKEYTTVDNTFHPRIIKTKLINKQEDLKIIRNKFKNNLKLTSLECCLLTSLPLFDLKESEAEIVEEICKYIKNNQNCIPVDEFDGIQKGTYLNILEYINPEKQEELERMINMSDILEKGEIAKFRQEAINEGKKEGIKEGIKEGKKEGIKEGIKEGKKAGIKEGIKEGKKEGRIDVAKNMLNKNFPITTIVELTGLSKNEILNSK